MRFDTVIIGGGLAGLICGLKLQKAGKKCAIVSSGQNTLHFFSGSFGLLSRLPDGTSVTDPISSISSLHGNHPYAKIGVERVKTYADEFTNILTDCGIKYKKSNEGNGYIISASGSVKPCWIALDEMAFLKSKDEIIGNKALIVNIKDFLDFNTSFIAESLEKRGTECRIEAVSTDSLQSLMSNPTELRSAGIAKVMSSEDNRNKFITKVNSLIKDEDVLILPAIFALNHDSDDIRRSISIKTCFIGTLPPSVPGIHTQILLKKAFESAGGVYLKGDKAISAEFESDSVVGVRTANLGDVVLEADSFVLASGSYFGHGLVAEKDKITEPVFALDVDFDSDRNNWYSESFFSRQNYMGFGVKTAIDFKAIRNGVVIDNLYAAGSILGGANPLYEGSGSGIAIMTALSIADSILTN